jgi:hypothetical protein
VETNADNGQETQNNSQGTQDSSQGAQDIDHNFALGRFIAQGRVMWYAGLTYSILEAGPTYQDNNSAGDKDRFLAIGENMEKCQEERWRPAMWYFIAVWALLSVLFDVFIALMVSFNTPTVGLGCRSFAFVLWGILGTITWFAHLFDPFPRRSIRILFHCINVVSVLWLATIMFLRVRQSRTSELQMAANFSSPDVRRTQLLLLQSQRHLGRSQLHRL